MLTRLLHGVHDLRRAYWRLVEPTVVGVRALVLQEGRVFLVRHSYLPGWYLPGGKVDRGETAATAVLREVAEECALAASRAELLAVYANAEQNRNDHILLYRVEDARPLPPAPRLRRALRALEIVESGFFAIDALPPETTAATRRRLAEFTGPSRCPIPEVW